jgi:hypothetical protein
MRTILAAFVALPLVAEAQPLFVEYEGTVESVEPSPHWDFRPGDRVKGVVKIDPSLAPPDSRPIDSFAEYSSGGPSDFVFSDFVNGNLSGDYLDIQVGLFGRQDRYRLADRAEIVGGTPGANWRDFTIEVTGMNLVRDDGIVQTFDAIPKKDGSSIVSALLQGLGDLRRTVTFALTRVSVTPGRCRA